MQPYLIISAVASFLLLGGCTHTGTKPEVINEPSAQDSTQQNTNSKATIKPLTPNQANNTLALDAPLCLEVRSNLPSSDLTRLIRFGMELVVKPVLLFNEGEIPTVCQRGYVMHYGIRAKNSETAQVKGKKRTKTQSPRIEVEAMEFVVTREGKKILNGEGPAVNGDITAQQVLTYATNMTQILYDRYTSGQLNLPAENSVPEHQN